MKGTQNLLQQHFETLVFGRFGFGLNRFNIILSYLKLELECIYITWVRQRGYSIRLKVYLYYSSYKWMNGQGLGREIWGKKPPRKYRPGCTNNVTCRINLKKNQLKCRGVEWSGWRYGQVAGSCEGDNEPSCSKKCKEFLDSWETELYRMDSASWK